MTSVGDIKILISKIDDLVNNEKSEQMDDTFWHESGAKLLVFIDQTIKKPELINSLTPRDYKAKNNVCLLASLFTILPRISNVNEPFKNYFWDTRSIDNVESYEDVKENVISFYELALSRCCSHISQLLGDRFHYVQKLLLKNIFCTDEICSIFASDIYMFIYRIIHPNHKMPMCLLVMNMCRIAPTEALLKGAALINRMKHPVVNFENPKYAYYLDCSA